MNIDSKKSVNLLIVVFVALIILGTVISYYYFLENGEVTKKYKVDILITQDLFLVNVDGFKAGLAEAGYTEGKNIEYIFRNTKGDEKVLKQYIDEIVAENPDIVFTTRSDAVKAIKAKNPSFPAVFNAITNLEGIIENPSNPEGNFTGIMTGAAKFADKRLEVLKKIAPSIKRVIVATQKDISYSIFMESARAGAKDLNLEIVEIPIKNTADFMSKLPEIINRKNGEAFLFYPGATNPNEIEARKKIVKRLISEKIPSINHQATGGAVEGILASYGNDRFKVGKQAASMASQILKGKPVKEIPVVFERDISLELNLATAKALGLEISQEIILQASKTYQTY